MWSTMRCIAREKTFHCVTGSGSLSISPSHPLSISPSHPLHLSLLLSPFPSTLLSFFLSPSLPSSLSLPLLSPSISHPEAVSPHGSVHCWCHIRASHLLGRTDLFGLFLSILPLTDQAPEACHVFLPLPGFPTMLSGPMCEEHLTVFETQRAKPFLCQSNFCTTRLLSKFTSDTRNDIHGKLLNSKL